MGRILQMHANKREDIEKVYSGDIAAAVGLESARQLVILCVTKNMRSSWNPWNSRIRLSRSLSSRRPKAGQEKMGIALAKLAEEDPTFKTYTERGYRTDDHRRYG